MIKKMVARGTARLLANEISSCTACVRLTAYCQSFLLAENQKTPHTSYWARPVPGFGDKMAEVLIIGLAPGAHGANRTGRPFTGDGAGEVLYKALHKVGFSNREKVEDIRDGLVLNNIYITNAVKCVPPGNRPTGEEKKTCLNWLADEWGRLKNVRIVLAMGKDAFESFLRLQKDLGIVRKLSDYRFQHGKEYAFDGAKTLLIATYHFSRYNMNTGVLTEEMVDAIFEKIRRFLRRD